MCRVASAATFEYCPAGHGDRVPTRVMGLPAPIADGGGEQRTVSRAPSAVKIRAGLMGSVPPPVWVRLPMREAGSLSAQFQRVESHGVLLAHVSKILVQRPGRAILGCRLEGQPLRSRLNRVLTSRLHEGPPYPSPTRLWGNEQVIQHPDPTCGHRRKGGVQLHESEGFPVPFPAFLREEDHTLLGLEAVANERSGQLRVSRLIVKLAI